jgi:hypothetical protein
MPFSRAAGRQAIFLGTTEPRAARPESPAAGSVVGPGQLVLSTSGKESYLTRICAAQHLDVTAFLTGEMLRAARTIT